MISDLARNAWSGIIFSEVIRKEKK
jgi:hypothetical protein